MEENGAISPASVSKLSSAIEEQSYSRRNGMETGGSRSTDLNCVASDGSGDSNASDGSDDHNTSDESDDQDASGKSDDHDVCVISKSTSAPRPSFSLLESPPWETWEFQISPDELECIVGGHDMKKLKFHGGVNGIADKLATSITNGIRTSGSLTNRRKICYCSGSLVRNFWFFMWEAIKDMSLVIPVSFFVPLVGGMAMEGWIKGAQCCLGSVVSIFLFVPVMAMINHKVFLDFMRVKKVRVGVTRDGSGKEIFMDDLLPGDIIYLRMGDQVPADGLFVQGVSVLVDKSNLTMESEPVKVNELNPFLLSGTRIVNGSCQMLVTAVGMRTLRDKSMATCSEGVAVIFVKIALFMTIAQLLQWLFGLGSHGVCAGHVAIKMLVFLAMLVAMSKILSLSMTLNLAFATRKIRNCKEVFCHQVAARGETGSIRSICGDDGTRSTNSNNIKEELRDEHISEIRVRPPTSATNELSNQEPRDSRQETSGGGAVTDGANTAPEVVRVENLNAGTQDAREMHRKNMVETAQQDADEKDDSGDQGGCKTRRADSGCTRVKVTFWEQSQAIKSTALLTNLENHPSIYIRLGRLPPYKGNLKSQQAWDEAWDKAFKIYSTAATRYRQLLDEAGFESFLKIQPIKINLRGYISALAERYFSETHTLHLGTFEIGPTPLAWTLITGIGFGGDPVMPPSITIKECVELLRLEDKEGAFHGKRLKLDVLCPSSHYFTEDPTEENLDWMFRRLIVYVVGSCFFSGADMTVPISLVSAMRDIRTIGRYDWGAATFSAFLRGMRRRNSQPSGMFSGFYPFLLYWAHDHLPWVRGLTYRSPHLFPPACRCEYNEMKDPIPTQSEFTMYRFELEYVGEDVVEFRPYNMDKFREREIFQLEIELSQKRMVFWGLESWEVYMGERNLRQFGGKIRIPKLPTERFCDDPRRAPCPTLMEEADAWKLLEDESCDYAEWFRTHSLGKIVLSGQIPVNMLLERFIL